MSGAKGPTLHDCVGVFAITPNGQHELSAQTRLENRSTAMSVPSDTTASSACACAPPTGMGAYLPSQRHSVEASRLAEEDRRPPRGLLGKRRNRNRSIETRRPRAARRRAGGPTERIVGQYERTCRASVAHRKAGQLKARLTRIGAVDSCAHENRKLWYSLKTSVMSDAEASFCRI